MGFQHVIPQFVQRMHQSSEAVFPIQGSGQETRSFIDIEDFAEGMRIVLDKGEHLQIYHLGNDHETPIAEVAQCVARSLQREIDIQPGTLLPGSTLRRCPDIAKMRALGFAPRVSLAQGIDRYVKWYLQACLPS